MTLVVVEKHLERWEATLLGYDTCIGCGVTGKEAIGDFFVKNGQKLIGIEVKFQSLRVPNRLDELAHAG